MGAHKLLYHYPFLQGYKEINTMNTELPNRHESSNEYRYGFNGMEEEDEIKWERNSYDFGVRIYDCRVGWWLSTDANETEYPSHSPFNFVGNTPLIAIDPNGEKIKLVIKEGETREQAFSALQKLTNEDLLLLKGGFVVTKSYYDKVYKEQDAATKGVPVNLQIEITGTATISEVKNLNKGTELINSLITADQTVTINDEGERWNARISTGGIDVKKTSVKVNFAPDHKPIIPILDADGNYVESENSTTIETNLAHELIHADRAFKGKTVDSNDKTTYTYIGRDGKKITETDKTEEVLTSGVGGFNKENQITENDIRAEQTGTERLAY